MHPTPCASVALAGTAAPLLTLRAPLSGRTCLAYQAELSLLQRLLDGWARPWRETAGARFVLHSHAGPLLVDVAGAELHLPVRLRKRVKLPAESWLDQRIASFCARLSRPPTHGSLGCRERRIEAGERVWVRGTLTSAVDPAGIAFGYRDAPRVPLLTAGEVRLFS